METPSNLLPATILYGNGLNRMTGENPTWEDVLARICKDDLSPLEGKVPNTLKYEDIYLAGKADLDALQNRHNRSDEYKIKWKIAQGSLCLEGNSYYDRLAHLDVKDYLTTNYDACLNKTFEKFGLKFKGHESAEKVYSTLRYTTYKEPEKLIWNIHGFAKYPSSIMLGFDQYCGSVAKLKNIQTNENPIALRLENGNTSVHCWADFFYQTNVHILGFSMDYSEIDLWWVLSERMRLMKKDEAEGRFRIKNEIHFYYIYTDKDDRNFETLLESMGVTVHKYKLNKHLRKNVRWVRLYDAIFNDLEQQIGTQEFEAAETAPMF